jgi:hypothetical protein
LSLFAGHFDTALVANDLPYDWLGISWASHPVTNVLLGSRGFTVLDDGGEYTRAEKAKAISAWPEAMKHLHVCFGESAPGRYENCCVMREMRSNNPCLSDRRAAEAGFVQARRERHADTANAPPA